MEKYMNRTAIILYLNLLIGLIHILHEFEILNFIPDTYYFIIPISFLFTLIAWNGLLLYDKNK
tara:strand:- start:117 stop:305 length:189 start_codon:yes stop_codon:yes gene_type:complete